MNYAQNKKAFHDYEVLEKLEAGVVLNGDEVKSIKGGDVNLRGCYVEVVGENAFLVEAHVGRYSHSSVKGVHEPTRKRKLLLHKKEVKKLGEALGQQGVTAIGLALYAKKGLIKLELGVCRGKKLYDKRESLKKKGQQRDIEREMKG